MVVNIPKVLLLSMITLFSYMTTKKQKCYNRLFGIVFVKLGKTTNYMKKLLLAITLLFSYYQVNAQDLKGSPFFSASLGTTLGINQEYDADDDSSGTLIEPKSILLRTSVGYYFDDRWAASFNLGYDHHFSYSINAIPMFGSLRYHLSHQESSAVFVEASYGQMFRLSHRFSNGNYYRFGLGFMSLSSHSVDGFVRIDYHRKMIAGFKNGYLDSLSLSIGFTLF